MELLILLGIGGIGLSIAFVVSRLRRHTPRISKLESKKVAANPASLKVGSTVYLDDADDTFDVQAVSRYEVKNEPDDFWYEFEIFDSIGNRTSYLACERDEEDRWRWSTHRKLNTGDVANPLDANGKPFREFTIEGRTWRVAPDCFNYQTHSKGTRIDRPEEVQETVRITDYVPTDGSAHELSIEVWKGGMCVTIGQACQSKILVLS
ncbi:MAG: hypothetical protein UU48_C0004G0019 [Candidatus Uhrbacteria bacterium GW2011_GWF2_41_16]|jgi:hypothetical protein|uniref:DUF4178 domain-containing protein n=2 Tax=Candidatus Uhriibacteriota TaxID=1752732 RepID=A0A0G0VEZ7_9BACT|nr:MAG: hypothetical protein UU35_C0010G0008 [Candidatus Uhrbacteria bacterium GW2011_GWC2_41_11]KKR98226.1 MAG: hypothetical protein UU48_C0004G0019 [Candidatus Uhrbacteria bacterium GW2011_GWF2_41_16]HBP00014.1 hypothetical protein [Candidatus Uhrbacteria bacterium]